MRFDYPKQPSTHLNNSRMAFALGKDDISALVEEGLENCLEYSKPETKTFHRFTPYITSFILSLSPEQINMLNDTYFDDVDSSPSSASNVLFFSKEFRN